MDQGTTAGFGRVKDILYKKTDLLGKGCDGTIVCRGKFNERDVAVKRLLKQYCDRAVQEVELLQVSCHPNVVRYYCMEEDEDFLFIALDLCEGTLKDYVEGKLQNITKDYAEGELQNITKDCVEGKLQNVTKDCITKDCVEGKLQNIANIKPIDLLHQAFSGLAHLHSLGIVHRDLKPSNILIFRPHGQSEMIAKISDFGLSKKLLKDRKSFSSKSSAFGTMGWTAPEMLESGVKKTSAVDVFSAGCVIYYVLTKGKHPFGSEISSVMDNIRKGIYDLDNLPMTSDGYVAKDIIQKMLSQEPGTRPTAKTVLHHPLFWCKKKKLTFIQASSEWTEVKMVHGLEQDGAEIVNGDWRNHLPQDIQDDVKNDYKKRRRHYNGTTVKDLLLYIRNKMHQYNEIPEPVKKSLGSLPEQFLEYFTDRFPRLLIHTYRVMEYYANEDLFKDYYLSE